MKKYLIRLFLALCCSLLPAVTLASPVGAITNAAGERIGIQDVPDRGDYPEKIHRRYCAESYTWPAIKASVLTPNGIKDARHMPAGEVLDIRCRELRTVWKTLPVFASDHAAQFHTVNAQLREMSTKLEGFGRELNALKVAVADLPPAVQRSLVVPSDRVPVWKTNAFWWYVLFAAVIALLLANLYGQPYYREITGRRVNTDGLVGPGFRSATRDTYREPRERQSNVWMERPESDPDSLQIFVLVGSRLFCYQTTKIVGSNAYPDLLRPGEARDEQVLANDVLEAVQRYCGTVPPGTAEERRWLDATLRDGRLREITLSLSR